MAEILTLMGTPKRLEPPKMPTQRLITCAIVQATIEGETPVNNVLAKIEGHMIGLQAECRRLAIVLGDPVEAAERIDEIERRVMGHD